MNQSPQQVRELSDAEVKNVVRYADVKDQKRHTDRWIDWSLLGLVIKTKSTEFTMNGHTYSAKFDGDSMFVQIVGNLTPCGWFSRDQIRKQLQALAHEQ